MGVNLLEEYVLYHDAKDTVPSSLAAHEPAKPFLLLLIQCFPSSFCHSLLLPPTPLSSPPPQMIPLISPQPIPSHPNFPSSLPSAIQYHCRIPNEPHQTLLRPPVRPQFPRIAVTGCLSCDESDYFGLLRTALELLATASKQRRRRCSDSSASTSLTSTCEADHKLSKETS